MASNFLKTLERRHSHHCDIGFTGELIECIELRICSKSIMETLEQCSGVSFFDLEQIITTKLYIYST